MPHLGCLRLLQEPSYERNFTSELQVLGPTPQTSAVTSQVENVITEINEQKYVLIAKTLRMAIGEIMNLALGKLLELI